MPLEEYRRKRDLGKSGEPVGGSSRGGMFVIQKHAARKLHYDLRLEIDGVLKSWAVPKGPSTDPKEKRLAVPTEDHPMDYADFEGVIPDGYGAGTVIVWDRGTYENLKDVPMDESFESGHITVRLHGKKLQGSYALVRTKMGWLLMKLDDEYADARNILSTEPRSVLSGKTIEDLAND